MNVAVAKGAPSGKNYAEYVSYLSDKGYVPPDAREWVDRIRANGNDANHEIKLMTKEDAEETIAFTEALLIFLFELPGRLKRGKGHVEFGSAVRATN